MKKLYIFLAGILAASAANAINVSIAGHDKLPNDTTIVVNEVFDDEFTGIATMELMGSVSSNGAVTVAITRSEADLEDEFCCGGVCTPGNQTLSQELNFPNVGNGLWYAHYLPKDKKSVTITYLFSDAAGQQKLNVVYDNTSSALENVHAKGGHQGVFSIFGQQLRSDNNTEGLPSGMYIVNGKKVIIR